MKASIVVEGPVDHALLDRLLDDLREEHPFHIIEARGRNAARPVARRELVTKQAPVVLVLDSDTTNEDEASRQLRELHDYLSWNTWGNSFKIVQFVPEIEVLFFELPKVLESIIGKKVDEVAAGAGKAAPRRVLSLLVPSLDRIALVKKLKPADLDALRKHPKLVELRTFLTTSIPQPRLRTASR